ncbi:hypothetical protein HMPREF1573_01162 [Gardnerella vaginalis JCP7276]|nr:hypothetical protein HMPREF1573_01162 [Gardnerella vaginalis JCP7276]EPI55712.1 hypothetical protein HMPREF1572_01001 [Gardnerella vaginalis JCP7275]
MRQELPSPRATLNRKACNKFYSMWLKAFCDLFRRLLAILSC